MAARRSRRKAAIVGLRVAAGKKKGAVRDRGMTSGSARRAIAGAWWGIALPGTPVMSMRRVMRASLLAMALAGVAWQACAQQPPAPRQHPCRQPMQRQFDFWIGEWT